MAITMNETSKLEELQKLLIDEETYIATTWASIQTYTPKLLTFSTTEKKPNIGFQHIYCYAGVTKNALNIVTLHSLDVTRVTGTFHIPLVEMKDIEIHQGVLKSSVTLNFGNEKLKLLWVNETLGMDIKNQRKQVKLLCEHISSIHKSV